MNSANDSDLIYLRIKKLPFGQSQRKRFKESLQGFINLHPVHSDRLQFIADMTDNFKLFWTFYTVARHFLDEGFRKCSQRFIKELIVRLTSASTKTDDGYSINNDVVKYLAELVIVYDGRLAKLFHFREDDQKELTAVEKLSINCQKDDQKPFTKPGVLFDAQKISTL